MVSNLSTCAPRYAACGLATSSGSWFRINVAVVFHLQRAEISNGTDAINEAQGVKCNLWVTLF
jgi:hypothetical protein